MRKRKNVLTPSEIFFYYFEFATIILYFLFNIAQEVLVSQGYAVYQSTSTQYYNFLLTVRLTISRYPSNITLVDASEPCPDYFSPINLWSVDSFSKATFVDITTNTSIQVKGTDRFYNNTQMGFKFYRFDINEPAGDSITLSNLYTFNTWKSYSICSKNMNLDADGQGLQFIPIDMDCTKVFPNDHAVDCGKFSNFRMCALKSKLMDDNKVYLPSLFEKIDEMNDVCPVNFVNLSFIPNQNYNPKIKDPSNNKYFYDFDMKTTKDEIYNDKILYLDFDLSFFTGCQTNPNITENYFYYVNPASSFFVMPADQNWGVKDSFSQKIDANDFTTYWSDYTSKFDLAPGFLNDTTMSNFYQLVDINPAFANSRVEVNLAMYENYVPSNSCVTNLLFNKNRYDFVNYLNGVLMPYYWENVFTFIIWNIASIFMSIYCSMLIRLRFIIHCLGGEARAADKRDENIMKFSYKLLQFFVFLVKVVCLSNIIKDINLIKTTASEVVESKCYDKQILNEGLLYAVKKLDETQNFYSISLYLLLTIFILEFFNFIFYIKLWYGKYSEYMEKRKEEEELRKEQELIQLAFNQNQMSKKID